MSTTPHREEKREREQEQGNEGATRRYHSVRDATLDVVRLRALSFFALSTITVACGSSSDASNDQADASGDADVDDRPPAICKTPPVIAGQWFTEVTDDVGLSASGAHPPLGPAEFAADLDGDGYDDFLCSSGTVREQADATTRTRFVFMNRPAPDDPTGKRRTFVDATFDSGLMATRDGVGGRGWSTAALGDVDDDGDVDAILCPGWAEDAPKPVDGCSAFQNDGTGHFTFFPESDLDKGVYSVPTAVYLDFDRDGVLDLFPATIGYWNGHAGSRMRLWQGAGDGTFVDVGASLGFPTTYLDTAIQHDRRMFSVTTCDLDGDGDQDLLCAMYGRDPNYVLLWDGGQFKEVGESLGIAFDDKMDYSDDDSYRCYCKNNPGACPPDIPPPPGFGYCTSFEAGQINGRGWVPGYSDSKYHLGGNNFALTCGDIDDDGDMDVMTAETTHGDVGSSSDRSELVINPTAPPDALTKFVRPGAAVTGIDRPHTGTAWNEGDNAPVFVDLDLDGRKDVYLASSNYVGTHGWFFHQKDDGTFEDLTSASGVGQVSAEGPVFIDYDLDGDLDLVLGTGTYNGAAPTNAVHFYRNDVGQDSNWTRIELVGLGVGHSNVDAIGARVKVTAGGRTMMQEVLAANGHSGGGQTRVLTFGLGAACEIDAIEVRWPDAVATTMAYHDVRANYRVRLVEGDAKPRYLP